MIRFLVIIAVIAAFCYFGYTIVLQGQGRSPQPTTVTRGR